MHTYLPDVGVSGVGVTGVAEINHMQMNINKACYNYAIVISKGVEL